MESSKVIKLKEPIKVGEKEITELTVRKPKAKDLRKLPTAAKTLSEMLDFAGHLCGEPPSTIDELGIEDAVQIFEVITDFLPDSLLTGKAQSA